VKATRSTQAVDQTRHPANCYDDVDEEGEPVILRAVREIPPQPPTEEVL
jgi:hypothetical protein